MPAYNSSCIQNDLTCSPVSSNCVIWQGEELPLISLQDGDSVSDAVYKLALLLQDINNNTDLADIDFSCLIAGCSACPSPVKTVKGIIKLLTEKVCHLMNSAPSTAESTYVLPTISIGCLDYTTVQGDHVITADLQEALKLQIAKFCLYKSIVDSHTNTLTNHETRITTLEALEVDNKIPLVSSSCLFSSNKEVSDAYEILDADYCEFKSMIGSASELNSAYSKICTGLNGVFGSQKGWTPNPSKLAHYFSNLYIMACNINDRVSYMEKTCCSGTCDDIVIGFITTFLGHTVVLSFTAGSGINIPTGYADCGSELTISDDKGRLVTYVVPIEIGQDTLELDISQFDKGDILHFSYNAKMCMDSTTCQKCYTKDVKYTTDCCVITNTGDGNAIIIYETTATA